MDKEKRGKAQITKIRNVNGGIITDLIRIIRDYEQLYINQLDNIDEMEKFLKNTQTPPLA